jgi:hypothetical protein
METWDFWYPEAAATGLSFARARVDPQAVVWVHAVPPSISISVRDAENREIAHAHALKRAGERYPLTRIARQGSDLTREDRWPTGADLGAIVILPGGEAGVLQAWWNAPDGSEWRWTVEFYNHT